MLDDLLVGHCMEQMEVELAVPDVRGEILYVECFFCREAYGTELGVGLGQNLFRRREFHIGKQRYEAAIDGIRCGARKLLKNYRPRDCLEPFAPRLNSKRADLRDYPREDWIGLAEMQPGFACIINFAGCHLTKGPRFAESCTPAKVVQSVR